MVKGLRYRYEILVAMCQVNNDNNNIPPCMSVGCMSTPWSSTYRLPALLAHQLRRPQSLHTLLEAPPAAWKPLERCLGPV